MTIKQVAQAFAKGRAAKCHNAHTDGVHYTLHQTRIARRVEGNAIEFNWGGWHTVTTANHMNHILEALGQPRVSRALHRDLGIDTFVVQP